MTDPNAQLQGEALVDPSGAVWLPYDRQHLNAEPSPWRLLSTCRQVRHAQREPFRWSVPAGGELHVLNGMGVTLGDSIIGIGVLAWLKAEHPGLRIHLYRSRHTPAFVERLYELAAHVVDEVHYLPVPLGALPADVVDLSDFLYWPRFALLPMVDFFLHGLGIEAGAMPASWKANRWIREAPLAQPLPQAWAGHDYVLLCDQASTPLRTVPGELAAAWVDRVWQRYRLPVLGFRPIAHAHYHDVSHESRSLDRFIAWTGNAAALVSTDSAAIHIAAAFEVPTLAVFVSIDPALRVRDYPHCRAVDGRTAMTRGLHAGDDPALLREVRQIWQAVVDDAHLPWPPTRALDVG